MSIWLRRWSWYLVSIKANPQPTNILCRAIFICDRVDISCHNLCSIYHCCQASGNPETKARSVEKKLFESLTMHLLSPPSEWFDVIHSSFCVSGKHSRTNNVWLPIKSNLPWRLEKAGLSRQPSVAAMGRDSPIRRSLFNIGYSFSWYLGYWSKHSLASWKLRSNVSTWSPVIHDTVRRTQIKRRKDLLWQDGRRSWIWSSGVDFVLMPCEP